MNSLFNKSARVGSIVLFALGAAKPATAQFGNEWLTLTQRFDVLTGPMGGASDLVANSDEKAFAVGDLDHDGWPDLVVVKSIMATYVGPREGRLLLNEKGKLVDRTDAYGTQSLSAGLGDLGLKQALDSSDVEIGDVNGDGWNDVVATQYDLSNDTSASAKRLTHPRVYMNLGDDAFGNWLGLRHEDARIPQLISAAGFNGVVRFLNVAMGDVDKDGDVDLYFSDFDDDGNTHTEPTNVDLDDRLLMNDGNGYFTDQTATRFATTAMWSSAFGTQGQIVDMNGDTKPDIVKVSTFNEMGSNRVEVLYNHLHPVTPPNFLGGFDTIQTAFAGQPYNFVATDLNNDGRPDLAIGGNNQDRYLINTGLNLTDGTVKWSSGGALTLLNGSHKFQNGSEVYSFDYDLDGWKDVIVADMDPKLTGCSQRTPLYHHQGGVPGATSVSIVEEKQQAGGDGWFGAVGWSSTYPTGVSDIASIDYDRDGDLDFVLGTCVGTDVWRNETNPITCQPTVAPISKGSATLSVCGAPLFTGLESKLKVAAGPANGSVVLLASLTSGTIPSFGGNVLAPFLLAVMLPLDAAGDLEFAIPGGGGTPAGATIYVQGILLPPASQVPTHITNIVAVSFFD